MKVRISILLLASCMGLMTQAQVKDIPFGDEGHIQYDLDRGTYNVVIGGRIVIKDAYAVCRTGEHSDSSISYPSHTWAADPISGGIRYVVGLRGGLRPAMQQIFFVYKGRNYFHTEVRLATGGCDYMSPLTTIQGRSP